MKNRYLVFINEYFNSAETENARDAFNIAFKTLEEAQKYCEDHHKNKDRLESFE